MSLITLLYKNVQFSPMVNLFQLPITDYALGIFVLWTVWVLSLISYIISPAGFMHLKPQSGFQKTVFEEPVQLSPIVELEVCLIPQGNLMSFFWHGLCSTVVIQDYKKWKFFLKIHWSHLS